MRERGLGEYADAQTRTERALADHVETMLGLHTVEHEDEATPDGFKTYCEGCWWLLEDDSDACPSMRSCCSSCLCYHR